MIKKTLILLMVFSTSFKSWPNNFQSSYEVIEINLVGDMDNPYFLPKSINLKINKRYHLKIKNNFNKNFSLMFKDWRDKVVTHHLLGANRMDKLSIGLPLKGEVEWALTPKCKGQYEVYESSLIKNYNKEKVTAINIDEE